MDVVRFFTLVTGKIFRVVWKQTGIRMRGWKAVRRKEPLGWGSFLLFGAAFVLSLGISALMLEAQGKAGPHGILLLLEGGFGHDYSLEDTLLKSIPIFLCAAGVAVCFRMQVWNIGAEGQYALGAVGATLAVLLFPGAPMWAMFPAMALCAMAAGALWAAIPAVLRLYFHMNEIISSLLLNFVGISLLRYLVYGPWKDPSGGNFPMSIAFPPAATLPALFGRVHWGLAVCVAVGVLLSFFFKRTRLGFEVMVGGENPRAARYAGMPYGFLVLFVLCLCGALAALAGGIETSATLGRLRPNVAVGYGYTAIVVAWLARLRISRIAFFAFVLAGLRVGVENLQLEMGVPSDFAGMIEGCVLLTVLAFQFFETYTLQRGPGGGKDSPSGPDDDGGEEGAGPLPQATAPGPESAPVASRGAAPECVVTASAPAAAPKSAPASSGTEA